MAHNNRPKSKDQKALDKLFSVIRNTDTDQDSLDSELINRVNEALSTLRADIGADKKEESLKGVDNLKLLIEAYEKSHAADREFGGRSQKENPFWIKNTDPKPGRK